jgi:chromate reductase, NAD(P)H dehydrogenase (quinone)
MEPKLKFLGFAGSLRVGSYNKALLRAAADLLPDDTILEIFDLNGIPPFNRDLELDMPAKVKDFKSKIREADTILIATPEYNYSVPGVLKNAIDSATRPYGDILNNQLQSLARLLGCLVVREHNIIHV